MVVPPPRFILLFSALVTLWLAVTHHSVLATTTSASCLALAGMGTNVAEIDLSAINLLRRLIPAGPAQWGVVAIGAAFVLLGVGAIISLKAAPPPKQEPAV